MESLKNLDAWIAVIFLAVVFIALAACTSNQQSAALSGASVVAGGKMVDNLIQSGEVERAVFSVELSESDRDQVITAFNDYATAREILGELVRRPEAALSLRATIQEQHVRVAEAYLAAQSVVAGNWDSYSAIDQARLKRWQAQAERLEIQYQNFLAAVDTEISADVRYERILEVLKIVAQLALMAV